MKKADLTTDQLEAASRSANIKLGIWFRMYNRWTAIHISLGITGIVSSAIVAGIQTFGGKVAVVKCILAIVAAISVSLQTFLNPSKRSEAFIGAWRLLDQAYTNFLADPDYDHHDLLRTMTEGEAMLS